MDEYTPIFIFFWRACWIHMHGIVDLEDELAVELLLANTSVYTAVARYTSNSTEVLGFKQRRWR